MIGKIIKSSIVIILLFVPIIMLYWYLNPNITNEDFHLEYEVSNQNKNFFNARNEKISKEKFTYNNETYYNEIDNYKIILHSLDFINNSEKIIIVTEYLDKNVKHRIANIAYKKEDGTFSRVQIRHENDSILIIQKLEHSDEKYENIIFKGKT